MAWRQWRLVRDDLQDATFLCLRTCFQQTGTIFDLSRSSRSGVMDARMDRVITLTYIWRRLQMAAPIAWEYKWTSPQTVLTRFRSNYVHGGVTYSPCFQGITGAYVYVNGPILTWYESDKASLRWFDMQSEGRRWRKSFAPTLGSLCRKWRRFPDFLTFDVTCTPCVADCLNSAEQPLTYPILKLHSFFKS